MGLRYLPPIAMVAGLGALALAGLVGREAVASPRAGELLFDLALRSPSFGGGAVGDLDGDGDPEILFGTYYRDERVLALHHDGSTLWELPSGGGPVDNSVTVADLDGDARPEVMWGNSETNEFHVAGADGRDRWTKVIGEVLDAPEAVGDVTGDDALEIVLASCGPRSGEPGGLRAFDGTSGRLRWTADVGGCYQSAPLLFDQDGDGRLDVVVSTWFDDKVRGFAGLDGRMRWETTIGGWTYHAGAFGDLSGDGVPDVTLGDYSGMLWALDGRDGAVLWSRKLEGVTYVFGPTAMGDLDDNGALEVVVAADNLQVFDALGTRQLRIDLPGYAPRGAVLVDADDDGLPDILTATDGNLGDQLPAINVHSGRDGRLLHSRTFPQPAPFNFHPTVADLDGDGANDVFAVYGRGQSDTPEANWGRAVAFTLGGRGPGWPTYGHDHHHSGNYELPAGAAINLPNTPEPTRVPSTVPTRSPTSAPSPRATPRPSLEPTVTAGAQPAGRAYLPVVDGGERGG